jgi:hypothetical protein
MPPVCSIVCAVAAAVVTAGILLLRFCTLAFLIALRALHLTNARKSSTVSIITLTQCAATMALEARQLQLHSDARYCHLHEVVYV